MELEAIIDDVTRTIAINDSEYKFLKYSFTEAVQELLTDDQFIEFMTIDTKRIFKVDIRKFKQFKKYLY